MRGQMTRSTRVDARVDDEEGIADGGGALASGAPALDAVAAGLAPVADAGT